MTPDEADRLLSALLTALPAVLIAAAVMLISAGIDVWKRRR